MKKLKQVSIQHLQKKHAKDGAIHFILSLNSVCAPVFIFAAS